MLIGPMSALRWNSAEVVGVAVGNGWSVSILVVGASVWGALYFFLPGEEAGGFDRMFPPLDTKGPAYPPFKRGRGRLLLLGVSSAPENAEVLLRFLESAFSIGNESAMVSCGVVVSPDGVPQVVPIGSEGMSVVSSGVVDSESVGIARDFRMLRKELPPFLSPHKAMGGDWIFESCGPFLF